MTTMNAGRSENVLNDLTHDSPLLLRNRKALHVFFWAGFFIYEGLIWGMVDGGYVQRISISAIELPLKIAATYLTIYLLIDRYLITKKYLQFLLYLMVSMALFGIALRVLSYYVTYPLFYPEGQELPLFFLPKILIYTFNIYSIAAIVATFHLIKLWYKHQQATQLLKQKAQQLQNEKLSAELKMMKSQINPHFLFNTLNNLYVLALNHSEKTPEMICKLSELMSYMLYECNQRDVPLENEIKYIENYVSLEKMRYDDGLDISINIYDDIKGIKVAPLLILPLVENCFKHGVHNKILKGWVRMDISIQADVLTVKVENSVSIPESEKSTKWNSGIGLQNLKRRLDFIYPDRHSLKIFDEEETFLVKLRINLETEHKGQKIFSDNERTITA